MCARPAFKGFVSTLLNTLRLVHQTRPSSCSTMGKKLKCKTTPKFIQNLYGEQSASLSSGNPDKLYTICVEGNIASGKTTFLELFKKFENVEVYEEPVKRWRNVDGHNILAKMYEDPARWSLTLQTYVQLTMLDQHIQTPKNSFKLMERSIFSAKYCFVENLHKGGKMTDMEYVVLTEWFNWIRNHHDLSVDLIVYLKTTPETVRERIQKRCRKEETTIPLNYLQTLHELHEDWLVRKTKFHTDCPVLVIDANKQTEEMLKIYEEKSRDILFGHLAPPPLDLRSSVAS